MKRRSALRIALAAVVACLVASAPAWGLTATTWQGSDGGLWSESGNWTAGVPVDNTWQAKVNGFVGTIVVDTNVTIGKWTVSGNGMDMVLDLQGHTFNGGGTEWFRDIPDSAEAEVIDTVGGGTFIGGGAFYRNNASDADEEYGSVTFSDDVTLSSPNGFTFPSSTGQNWYAADARVVFQDQATFTTPKQFELAGRAMVNAYATFTVTVKDEASFFVTSTSSTPTWGLDGYAMFEVIGNAPTVDIDMARLTFGNGGVRVVIDDLAQDAALDFRRHLNLGTVDLDIDLADGVTPAQDQVFDVLLWGNGAADGTLTGTFVQDPEDVGVWEIIYNTDEKKVQARYVPEPATLMLLALCGPALLRAGKARRGK